MKLKVVIYIFCLFLLNSCSQQKKTDPWIISAPAGDRFVTIDKTGETIIPNGRILTPVGKNIVVAPHPFGLTLSLDGNTAITANSGTSPLSITIIRNILSENPEVQQIPPGPKTDEGILASVFMGLPYLNQYDAGATDFADFFTEEPDFKPYTAIPVDSRIFDPQKALNPFDENFDWKALEESPVMDNKEDMIRESKEKDEYRLENREK